MVQTLYSLTRQVHLVSLALLCIVNKIQFWLDGKLNEKVFYSVGYFHKNYSLLSPHLNYTNK